MDKIQLEGRVIEEHYGRNIDRAPALLERWKKGEGAILSEADIRLYGTQKEDVINNYWDTSTLSATKGEDVKVILPYETGSRELTVAAEFALGLINSNEKLVDYGVNLDIEGRWEKLEGSGVYTLQRDDLILNQDLTEIQAMNHKLLLTKLGHPDYVDEKFARSRTEVAEIIGKAFGLRERKHGSSRIMGQYLSDFSNKGVLKVWYVSSLDGFATSNAMSNLDNDDGRFSFDNVGDAMDDATGLEGVVGQEIVSALNSGEAFEYNGVLYVPTGAKNAVLKK